MAFSNIPKLERNMINPITAVAYPMSVRTVFLNPKNKIPIKSTLARSAMPICALPN
jgi:hypothetical protein